MNPITDILLAVLVIVLTGNLTMSWRNGFRTSALTRLVDGFGNLLEGFGEHLRANRDSQHAMAHYCKWLAEHIDQGGVQPPPPTPEIR